jgi:hypothetical protein
VQVPSVIAAAPADPQHPMAMAEAWAEALPGSRLTLAPSRDQDPDGYHAALARATQDLLAM